MRRLLRRGVETLNENAKGRLDAALQAGDPDGEVTVAWWSAQQLRAVYHAPDAEEGRRRAQAMLDALPGCPIPEVARLGRTLRAWRAEFLAYLRHRRSVQRADRGDQLAHREAPPRRPRLQELRQLPTAATPHLRPRLAH